MTHLRVRYFVETTVFGRINPGSMDFVEEWTTMIALIVGHLDFCQFAFVLGITSVMISRIITGPGKL